MARLVDEEQHAADRGQLEADHDFVHGLALDWIRSCRPGRVRSTDCPARPFFVFQAQVDVPSLG
jgi:hypothetical protein